MMDYSFFKTEKGEFKVTRLPTTKRSSVIIRDNSELDDVREEVKEQKPKTLEQFGSIYEEWAFFDAEIEDFETVILKNRNSLLGSDVWVKTYWDTFYDLVGNFDVGELELNTEEIELAPKLIEILLPNNYIDEVKELNEEHWSSTLDYNYKLPELKKLCQTLDIKITKKNKGDLINDLIEYESNNPGTLKKPNFVIAQKALVDKFKDIYQVYVDAIEDALLEFDYPDAYQLAVWESATNNAEGEIRILLEKKMKTFEENITPFNISDEENLELISEGQYHKEKAEITPIKKYKSAITKEPTYRKILNLLISIFNWVFGGSCLLAGFGTISESIIGSLVYFTIALLLLPPFRKLIYKITGEELPALFRVTLVIILIVVGGSITSQVEQGELEVSNLQQNK